jgi:hypothetical protein
VFEGLTLLHIFSDNEDEIFVDADDTTIEPMQESFHESFNPMDQDSSSTTAQPDPIFHAYTTQQSQDNENGAVNSENEATSSDVSVVEFNELEWDTCIIDGDTPLNEGSCK